ncbi:MAG: 2-oxoacid:ferredoxin oxidoreductase subunit gamma [Candidatus Muiribacterium halophilum]|uniref:2-oxoacid:ferredoxin oxidoreductase subunit gamma n=1 Tax=Muiribacterium halophilum TaxID=2053465 RepID=A0A2N5ZCB0_MUIH1|nr:MAG: 2-oxoacid:ferredoxin oxidoreductase subunit gamma [Candidatus Muirbacterium halophilum]
MNEKVIMAGFGGQGIMLMGQVLAYAGMLEDKEISWIPSYGPEMRGGTANCNVIVSERKIGSPVISIPDTLIAMNRPSMEKFEESIEKDGILIYNSSLIDIKPKRDDIKVYALDISNTAKDMGNTKIANMIALGSYIKATGVVSKDSVMNALKKMLPERHHDKLPLNEKALEKGMELIS